MSKILKLVFIFFPLVMIANEEVLKLPDEIAKLGLFNLSDKDCPLSEYNFSEENLEKMRCQFRKGVELRKECKSEQAIKIFWNLAYDGYGPANGVFTRAFTFKDEYLGISENDDWATFFGRLPNDEIHMMNYYHCIMCNDEGITSSRGSTAPNASFSSRETTPPKDDERDESQPLLGSAAKYVKPSEGLRRRNVGGVRQ